MTLLSHFISPFSSSSSRLYHSKTPEAYFVIVVDTSILSKTSSVRKTRNQILDGVRHVRCCPFRTDPFTHLHSGYIRRRPSLAPLIHRSFALPLSSLIFKFLIFFFCLTSPRGSLPMRGRRIHSGGEQTIDYVAVPFANASTGKHYIVAMQCYRAKCFPHFLA